MRRENEFPAAISGHNPYGTQGILRVTEPIVNSGEEMTVYVYRTQLHYFFNLDLTQSPAVFTAPSTFSFRVLVSSLP